MQEKIWFENSKGDRLCGILSDLDEDREKPVVILVPDLSSNKDRDTFTRLEKELNEKRIATFRIDLYAHGESEGKFENLTISEGTDDILRAIDFLEEKGYKKIGLMGSSFGGIASTMAASKTGDLYLLVLKCPVSNYMKKMEATGTNMDDDLEEWKEKGQTIFKNSKGQEFKVNYTFVEDFVNNDGYVAAEKIKIPVFIIHGDEDSSVPVEQSKKTADILENCKLEIVEGANHFFDKEGQFDHMINSIVDFIVEKS